MLYGGICAAAKAPAQYLQALSYYESGKYYQAKKQFIKYLSGKPDKNSAHYRDCLFYLGASSEELESYREALGFYELYLKVAGPGTTGVSGKEPPGLSTNSVWRKRTRPI